MALPIWSDQLDTLQSIRDNQERIRISSDEMKARIGESRCLASQSFELIAKANKVLDDTREK